jgi:hypothetical protein
MVDLIPEVILDCHLVKRGNTTIVEVKVKWVHLPPTLATWEDLYVLHHHFLLLWTLGLVALLKGARGHVSLPRYKTRDEKEQEADYAFRLIVKDVVCYLLKGRSQT